jgi:hypothetical protein
MGSNIWVYTSIIVIFGAFPRLSRFGMLPAIQCASRRMVAGRQGVRAMNFNIANLQQFAVSILGALITSSIFITAAVGPGAPIF